MTVCRVRSTRSTHPMGWEQVARDQLGMVSEGEIVFEDVGD